MKLSIETVFNDAGESHEAPLNRVFLGQRKWVVLCGAIVFLISNGYVALNQEWLLLSLNIHSGSIRLLSAVSFTCLLFGLYMFFGSYAFFKKHVIEQRIRFAYLEIEERDIYSTRISELSQQVANVNVELSSKMEAKIKLIDQIATSRETYSELLELARLQEAGSSAPPPKHLEPILMRYEALRFFNDDEDKQGTVADYASKGVYDQILTYVNRAGFAGGHFL